MSGTKTLISADELMQMPADGNRYELIKGELKQMAPAGGEHGVRAMRFAAFITIFVLQHKLGEVCAAETGFKISSDPDTVRAPDAAFVCRQRIPDSGIPKGYWPCAPDLVVEVISPNDIYDEVDSKVEEWLAAGTRMVVVINPRKQKLSVHRSSKDVKFLTETDTFSGEDILPGFTCAVVDIFS